MPQPHQVFGCTWGATSGLSVFKLLLQANTASWSINRFSSTSAIASRVKFLDLSSNGTKPIGRLSDSGGVINALIALNTCLSCAPVFWLKLRCWPLPVLADASLFKVAICDLKDLILNARQQQNIGICHLRLPYTVQLIIC
jgi:hypothetical protein